MSVAGQVCRERCTGDRAPQRAAHRTQYLVEAHGATEFLGDDADTIVAHGTIDELADRTRAHWDAGADHVSVNVQPDTEDPVPTLRALAAAASER
ncbi:hypothetical protein GCM10017608_10770 [Agromyces luteolus]|nr:hypothetical protein GCM10017608_10770 [Agromyces luteolus]